LAIPREQRLELVDRPVPKALMALDPGDRFLQRLLSQTKEVHPTFDTALNQFRLLEQSRIACLARLRCAPHPQPARGSSTDAFGRKEREMCDPAPRQIA